MATTYYVYKALRSGRFKNWEFHSKYDVIEDAEKAARDLCPKGEEIETAPGWNLKHGFFGSKLSDNWSAMISPIESSEAALASQRGTG